MEKVQDRTTGRSYNQWCGMARGLDIIGERWTLLILRDLLLGPQRYKDLLAGLPGIGTNLLAARLKELERRGVVRRTVLPAPAGSTVYELTEIGEQLRPALFAIGRFGGQFLEEPAPGESFPVTAHMLAARANFQPQEVAGFEHVYELRVGDQVFEIEIRDGEPIITQRPAREANTRMTMDAATFNALLRRAVTPRKAVDAGRVELAGEMGDFERFFRMFTLGHLMERPARRRDESREVATGLQETRRT